MRARLLAIGALAVALLAAACSAGDAAQSTDDLTRSLLAQPVSDGNSTPTNYGSAGDQGPAVPVSQVGFNRGDIEAPVKVVELSDYGCGYCRKFHQESFPTLLTEFIESGKVEWKFVPYITGMFENSLAATEAADCTYVQDEAAFETLNSRLWADQPDWKGDSDPEAVVRGWVSELGIDMDVFDTCLAGDERMDRVAAATLLAQQIGVRGTPTFVIIGYPPLQGARPLEMFQDILTRVHADATAEGGE
jgi:protein-disulfide isomerase